MKMPLFLIAVFATSFCQAQWSNNPRVNTVWEQPENQGAPVICTDGDGGAIVAWGSDHGIRANRIDKFGYRQWGNNGMPILPAPGPRTPTNIIPDGRGGAVIVWEDFTKGFQIGNQNNPENEMYAQRVDRTGKRLWDTSGVLIRGFITKTRVGDFQIVSDDYQTFMISWYDEREPVQWYVQRIDLNGTIAFERNGRAIPHENKVNNGQRRVVSDGKGGILMARGNEQLGVVVEKINKDGTFPWPLGGIPTYTGGRIGMTSDGHGGAILSGIHFTSGPPNFDAEGHIQRIDSTGKLLWGTSGKIFTPDADAKTFPHLVSDNAGGAFVTWDDTTSGKRELYVTRFNNKGQMVWKTKGFRLWNRSINGPPSLSNEKGSIIWLMTDFTTLPGDLYTFLVDSNGVIAWGMDGILIRFRNFEEWPYFLEVTPDAQGGFLAVWSERRNPGWQNLVLQQVSLHGRLGDVITRVDETIEVWSYPESFVLLQPFPNPSNPATKISFSLRNTSDVLLRILDVTGQQVITLIERQLAPGKYTTQWNGLNQTGKEVTSGIYFCQIVVGSATQVRKLILIH